MSRLARTSALLAFALATGLRDELSGLDEVTSDDIRDRVYRLLEENGHLGALEKKINDFVLINWCGEGFHGLRIASVELQNLLFLALIPLGFLEQTLIDFVLTDLNIVGFAHF